MSVPRGWDKLRENLLFDSEVSCREEMKDETRCSLEIKFWDPRPYFNLSLNKLEEANIVQGGQRETTR